MEPLATQNLSPYDAYLAYFEEIARTHLQILFSPTNPTFKKAEVEELLAGQRTTEVDHCLFLQTADGKLDQVTNDHINDNRSGSFVMLFHRPESNYTYADRDLAIKNSEIIVKDIISKMRYDKRSPNGNPFITTFNLSTVAYGVNARFMGDWWGTWCTFTYGEQIDLSYKPDRWLP